MKKKKPVGGVRFEPYMFRIRSSTNSSTTMPEEWWEESS